MLYSSDGKACRAFQPHKAPGNLVCNEVLSFHVILVSFGSALEYLTRSPRLEGPLSLLVRGGLWYLKWSSNLQNSHRQCEIFHIFKPTFWKPVSIAVPMMDLRFYAWGLHTGGGGILSRQRDMQRHHQGDTRTPCGWQRRSHDIEIWYTLQFSWRPQVSVISGTWSVGDNQWYVH